MTTTLANAPAAPPTTFHAWHTLQIDDALVVQGVDGASCLSSQEVEARTQQYGPNSFTVAKKESRAQAFRRQFKDPMQIVLPVAGVITIAALRQWR